MSDAEAERNYWRKYCQEESGEGEDTQYRESRGAWKIPVKPKARN